MTEISSLTLEFTSVLVGGRRETPAVDDEPAAFHDLNLDQVVAAITAGRDEYDLKPFFHATSRDVDAVTYRHEVFRDLESAATNAAVRAFADEMRRARRSVLPDCTCSIRIATSISSGRSRRTPATSSRTSSSTRSSTRSPPATRTSTSVRSAGCCSASAAPTRSATGRRSSEIASSSRL